MQIRSGSEVTWATVFLEPEADEEGKDKIELLTGDKFQELMGADDHEDGTSSNNFTAVQVPHVPNFCWYWKRAYNETTVATFGTEPSSPVRAARTRLMHPTTLNPLTHDDIVNSKHSLLCFTHTN